jgi:predicted RND superfamily exporter protein
VLLALVLGVVWTLGLATLSGERLNFLNFIALPITFGIGSEYPFNIFDRSRLLGGDVTAAVKLHFGAVALCSYTTVIGYGSLLFADNQALRSFGRLATSGEIACVVAALLFLPSLLHLLDGWHARRRRDAAATPVVERG